MTIPILAYHKVAKQFEWGINTVLPRSFAKQIKYLADNGFHSIQLSQYLSNPQKYRKPVIITFDDSFQSIYTYAYPILREYGFTATIFVISNYVGKESLWDINLGGKTSRHLSWDEISELALSGWEIGSHSATHPDLTKLSRKKLIDELMTSKIKLETQLGIQVNFISYPFNRYNTHILKIAKEVGYSGGCCSAINSSIPYQLSQYSIPRRGVYFIDNLYWFKLKLQSNTLSKIDDIRQKIICFCSQGSIYYNNIKKIKKNIAI